MAPRQKLYLALQVTAATVVVLVILIDPGFAVSESRSAPVPDSDTAPYTVRHSSVFLGYR